MNEKEMKTFDKAVKSGMKMAIKDRSAKHTPGPWEVHPQGDFDSFEIHPIGDDDGIEIVAMIDDELQTSEVKEANANLIAAAPDLLEAAKNLLGTWHKTNPSLWNALQNAINRAEGN